MSLDAQKVRDIFVAAVKYPPDQWEVFLEGACSGDEELRHQVSDLLREHQQAGSFLDRPAAHVRATGDFDPAANGVAAAPEGPGTVIGPYKLLEPIGEGGMGAVWMAEQREPVQRKVALKIIKAGMDSRQVVARFEAERQALALMDHTNIAKVFDGGTTASGRPYFVMELVKGVPITHYCDEHRLTPRERLELFVPVCQAIQHAHTKGIIHRDVKPANVLVAPYDGRPVPKVIDFGVAKATGQRLTERTLFTGLGTVVGTLEYMSPEQAELNNQDIDTRSDIYALGVLLYELLTGTTPLSHERLKEAVFTEMLRAIREEEPPKPSARLSESKETLPSVAAQRHTEPARLTKLVRGDLDWIVMKALEKDRSRRYETAAGLARDVENYLADEPVEACPPSVSYRLRKLVRRHRGPVLAAATILFLLLAGIIGTTWGLIQAEWARSDAVDKEQAADTARKTAQDEKQTALTEKKRAEKQLRRTEVAWYAGKLAQAQREWQDGNGVRALEILEGTQWDLREWEFGHLWTRFNSKQTLRGHMGPVTCLAFSPDGKRLVSGDNWASTLKVWDAAKGQEVLSLKGHTGEVFCVAFSPDGKHIVSGSQDKTLKVWDAKTGQERLSLKGHTTTVSGVAFSPDSKRIVSSSWDSTLKVWDAETGQEVLALKGHTGRVNCLAFSPDGKRIVSGGDSQDQTLKLWDAKTGQERLSLKGHTGPVYCVAFSFDSKRIVSGSGFPFNPDKPGELKVWDAAKGQEVLTLKGHTGGALCVAFSPDGKRLVSGGGDLAHRDKPGELKLWDADKGQLLLSLQGHTGIVNCVAFSPNGKHIVSGGGAPFNSGELNVWDAAKGQEVLVLKGHTGPVSCVAFSADGKRLVSGGSADYTLKVWDAAKGQEVLSLLGHTGPVSCVAFSPDGKRIVSGGEALDAQYPPGAVAVTVGGKPLPGELKVWDADRGREVLTLKGHTSRVSCVAFSPDGKRIVSGSKAPFLLAMPPFPPATPRELKMWDADNGREVLSLKGHTGDITCVAFSPNGKRIVSGGGDLANWDKPGELKVWEAKTGQEVLSLKGHTAVIRCVAFCQNGKRIVSGGGGYDGQGRPFPGELKVWDAYTGREVLSLKGHTLPVSCVAFSPDGKRIVSGCGTLGHGDKPGELKVWDADTGQELLSLQGYPDPVLCVAFSPDGKRIVSGSTDRTLKVWDADRDQEALSLRGHTALVRCVAFSPDSKRIVSGGVDRTLKVWDAVKGQEVLSLLGHTDGVFCVAFSPDGKHIVSGGEVSGAQKQGNVSGEVKVWNADSGQEVLSLKGHTGPVPCLAFSPDGKHIVSGSWDKTLKVWDANSGQEVLSLKGHAGPVTCLAFSPDGKHIVSGSQDKSLKLWDADTGQERLSLKGHTNIVSGLAFSPDGKRIVSGSWDSTLKVWDAETGQEVLALKGHTSAVRCVAFSPDGKRLVSGGVDRTLKVWDAAKGQEVLSLQGHTGEVFCVAFSPDGKRLVSGSTDQTLKVWSAN